MITALETLLKNNNLYHEQELRYIPKSCCNGLAIKFLDFDRIKDDFSKTIQSGIFKLRSVDALFLSHKTNTILMVEMKKYNSNGTLSASQYLKQYFLDKSVPTKFVDSLILLLSICGFYGAHQSVYSHLLNPQLVTINKILLVNLTAMDYSTLMLASLNQQNISLTKRLDGPVKIVRCGIFTQYMGNYI